MIDLTSTHDGVEEDVRCAAHLIAGVIAMAVEDLCMKPTEEETKNNCNLNNNAISSLKFFFNSRSIFPVYASFIGIDANSFVRAMERREFELNGVRKSKQAKTQYLSQKDVSALKTRICWWQKSPVQSRQLELQL
jgi:hypothetical protein